MKIALSTTLACAAEEAIEAVRTTRLLQHVAAPILIFRPIEPKRLPEAWGEGRYRVMIWLFGIIPFGRQWVIVTEHPGTDDRGRPQFRIRDNGSGDIVRVWDHWITIAQGDHPRETRYQDAVEIKAGLLTPFIYLFAQWFYRHRQGRWRRLVRRGFKY